MATYVVANVSDGGLGSLRQAIIDANSHAGPDQINFAIPGAGSHTIQPSTALPTITDPVNIDGTTQSGSIRNSLPNGNDAVLKIELDGSLAGSAHGLWITAGNSSVRGLVINRFAGDGIRLEALGGNVIEGNFIGVDPTGVIAMGNGTSGIGQSAYFGNEFVPAFGIEIVGGSSDNIIGTNGDDVGDVGERNVISSNIKADVFISGLGTNRNVVAGNFIGTNAAGTGSFGPVAQGGYNYNVGVFINGGSQSNRVGTDGNGTADAAERNIISGHFGNTGRADDHHSSRGVEIANLSSTTTTLGLNVVAGNYIGTDVTGTKKLGNGIGVGMQLGDRNRIGTNSDGVADAAERNLISGNSVGIHLFGSNQNVISGNYVGTDVTGTTNTGTVAGDLGNSTGIWVLSSASNIVGGTAAGAGNLVSGNTYYGIQIQGNNNPANSGADNNTVQANLIGTNATGTVAISNGGYGLYLNSNSNLIGGTTTAARNVISASGNVVGGDGIHVVGYSNVIQGNYIGTDISGTLPLGNSGNPVALQGNGIRVLGGTGNRIGGAGTGEGNLIAFNVGAGVMVSGYDPTGNAIRGNSIHSNNGLGIDLAPWATGVAGVTSNDMGDSDLGPNGYQNFPLLVSAHSSITGTTIAGTLNSTPMTVFALDFYSSPTADPFAHGEGKTYLGSGTAMTDVNGNVAFNVTVSGVAAGGQFVAATATHPDGSTSEFSANEIACFESPSLIVTTTSDVVANDCETSLREAINYANSRSNSLNPGNAADMIRFNIPGIGPHIIQVLSALPTLTDPVVIDGYTQPGSSVNTLANGDNAVLKIELSGALAGPAVSGLVLTGGNNTVRGLAIHSFTGHGIQVGDANLSATPAGSVIEGNFIGTNASGAVKLGNFSVGIHVINSSNNLVGTNADGVGDPGERNIILGNNFGVFIQTAGPTLSHDNVVAGNFLGTDRNGTISDPNGVPGDGDELGNSYGIKIANSNFNTVGGTSPAARNVISGNTYLGVHIQGTGHQGATLTEHNVVQGNLIGTDVTGTLDRGNGVAGVDVESAEFTQVGGVTAAARNIISGNDAEAGLWLNNAFSTVAQGNYIGTDITGTLPLGNTGSTYFLGGNGVKVQIGANNIVGGTAVGEGNLIANNNGAGVLVTNNNFIPTSSGNAIRGNSIFANGGLGIDIAPNGTNTTGVTGNDVGDVDVGPNGYQNFPLIASAQSTSGGTTITGTLNSTPLTTFTLDFYTNVAADPSGYGEGQTYLGSANVTTDINGDVSFNATVPGVAPVGWFVSATATNSASSTSEFSGLATVIAGSAAPTNLVLNSGMINENGTFTLTGSFSDVDVLDTHTVTIYWGEGLPEVRVLLVGARTFSFSHQYLDDNPTTTNSDVFPIGVQLSDGNARSISASTNVTINNVAPTNLSWTLSTDSINENGTITVNGSFVDVGTLDVHTVTIHWGEGIPVAYSLPVGARTFSISHQYLDDNPTATSSDGYSVKLSLSDDDSGVGSSLIYGLKSRNGGAAVGSIQPTHLFTFNSDGTGLNDIGAVKLGSTNIDADALAYSPTRGLFAFQIHSSLPSGLGVSPTDCTFVSVNPTTAAATVIGNRLTGRVIRAATFDNADRLWVIDRTQDQLLQMDPISGQFIGGPINITLNGNPHDVSDLAQRADGTFIATDFAVGTVFYTLDINTGVLIQVASDPLLQAPAQGTTPPSGFGIVSSGSTVFTYDAQGTDDIYQYDTVAGYSRSLVFANIVPSYNSGQGDLASATENRQVTVRNLSPVIDSYNAPVINEDETATISGSFADVGTLDTHTVTITWGDGTSSPAIVNPLTRSFSASHQYLDDAVSGTSIDLYTIGIAVTDDDTGAVAAATTVTVKNVAPVIISLNNSSPQIAMNGIGQSVNVSGLFSDVGRLDTHTASVNWGDGSTTNASIVEANGSGSLSGNHAYSAGGIYTVTVTLRDDDTGSTSQTTTSIIVGVGLVGNTLYIIGSNSSDKVEIEQEGQCNNSQLEVDLRLGSGGKQERLYSLSQIQNIVILMAGGNDDVEVDCHVDTPTYIDGGTGNDDLQAGSGDTTMIGGLGNDKLEGGSGNDWLDAGEGNDDLRGGNGNDIMYGGDGNDQMDGGNGNDIMLGGAGIDDLDGGSGLDLLIGGLGADRLNAGSGGDILVGGTTSHDANEIALTAILSEWTSPRSYSTRLANIRGTNTGTRSNANYFLNATTVQGDSATDRLTGSTGLDWFWATVGQDTDDKKSNEERN